MAAEIKTKKSFGTLEIARLSPEHDYVLAYIPHPIPPYEKEQNEREDTDA